MRRTHWHRIWALAPALLWAVIPQQVHAGQHYTVDPAHSDVAARVPFFAITSKTAHFPKMSGKLVVNGCDAGRIDLDILLDARALTAPDAVTLGRLKGASFFDVARYPTVRFRGERMKMTTALSGTVEGEISARGVARPVTLAVTFARSPFAQALGGSIDLVGRTVIDRRAFGMTDYALVVGRRVTITINARLNQVPVMAQADMARTGNC